MKRIPLCIIIAFTSLGLLITGRAQDPPPAKTDTLAAKRIPVVTTPAEERVFEDCINVQGNVEAGVTAWVPARIKGTLLKLFVDEGDVVEAGETPLFQTDDLNLKNALELRRLDLAVAKCGVQEKLASLERQKADLDRKVKDYKRLQRLFEEDGIGTLDRVEQAESDYKQALASVKHAETLVALSKEQSRQAETAVKIAEKDLSDATVLAPISGVISDRLQEPGEMGETSKPVFRIVDLDELEVSAFLPADFYAAIVPEQTRIRIEINGNDLGEKVVSYRAPIIDPSSRVFEIKCKIGPQNHGTAPGAMASVRVVLRREKSLGVPSSAVVHRQNRDVVFQIAEGAAHAVPIEKGMITEGWVQALNSQIQPGSTIVTMGQFLLNDGSPVQLKSPAKSNDDVAAQPNPLTDTSGSN